MPIFTFTKQTRTALILMLGDGHSRDCMGVVMRDTPDGAWYFRYRFRYYDVTGREQDPDAPDTKNVAEFRAAEGKTVTRAELIAAANTVFSMLKDMGFGDRFEQYDLDDVDGDGVIAAMRGSDFMHIREVTKADPRQALSDPRRI